MDRAIVSPCSLPGCGVQACIMLTVLDGSNQKFQIDQDTFLCDYHFALMVLDTYDSLAEAYGVR
jgi:hypothetical protein